MKTMKEIYDWVKENITISDSDIIESSDAVLENKQGNVHSIANLLESMLIENGYECKKVFELIDNSARSINGVSKITKIKPGECIIGHIPFINTTVTCKLNNEYYYLDILANDIKGPYEKDYHVHKTSAVYETVYYDIEKDYTGSRVQDLVFDLVNNNPVFGKVIWYPVYE